MLGMNWRIGRPALRAHHNMHTRMPFLSANAAGDQLREDQHQTAGKEEEEEEDMENRERRIYLILFYFISVAE